MKKLTSKTAQLKIQKTAMESSNFYLAGGIPEEDSEMDKFLKSRFNGNSIQDCLFSKNASTKLSQYNFYRIDRAPEEFNSSGADVMTLNFPGSLMDLIFKDSRELVSKEDEEVLYSLWKSSKDSSEELRVGKKDISKAEKLMNRGYLIDKEGKYQLTEKGRKILISKVLGSKPKIDDDFNKTSQAISDSPVRYILKGNKEKPIIPPIELHVLHFVKNPDFAIVEANDKVVNRIKQEGLFSKDKVKMVEGGNYLAIPADLIEENREKRDPYTNTNGQNPIQNAPNSNSPMANLPVGESGFKSDLNKYSSSKIVSMAIVGDSLKQDNVVRNSSSFLQSRGLKMRFIASDDRSREKGLMFSEPLKDDECALFVFDKTGNYGFWNRNVNFPIDVSFYGADKKLLHVGHLEAHQEIPVFPNGNKVKYVIETKSGWFDKNEISKGSSLFEVVEKSTLIK